jgi:hypothetical protein
VFCCIKTTNMKLKPLQTAWFVKFGPMLLLTLLLGFANESFTQITLNVNVTQPICYGLSTGSIAVTPIGAVGQVTYNWNTGASTSTLQNIPAGNYSVTVSASNGVTSQNIIVTQPTEVLVSFAGDTCQLPTIITASGSGGTGPYTYAWNNGTIGPTTTILTPGVYEVTVVDATWCGRVAALKITATPVQVSLQSSGVTCNGLSNGQITANASGGIPPYTYMWSNGSTTASISNLLPGNYSVTVTDSRLCTRIASATVTTPPVLAAQIVSARPTCLGFTNGSALVTVTGGTPPYTYLWNNGSTMSGIMNLGAGSYSVTVRDANNCTVVRSVTLTPISSLVLGAFGTPPPCEGQATGTAIANPNGGIPPYSYLWSTGATTQTINNLLPATYGITVTDNVGCVASATATVPVAPAFSATIIRTNVTTCGANNGTATVTVTQGTPPYTYAWSNNVTGTNFISNLSAGTYTVTVTSGSGCQLTRSITVTEPPAVSVTMNASVLVCVDQSNGMATATPSGGTAPFSYAWNNNATTQTISGIPAGTYTVTVTDAFGCTASASRIVQAAPVPVVTINANTIICGAGNSGSATAVATVGAAPFTYLWNTGAVGPSLSGFPPGTFSVTATDVNGCRGSANVTFELVDDLEVRVNTTPVRCFGEMNGSATAIGSGGDVPYTFTWSNTNFTGALNSNLIAGTYTVTMTDANGCTATNSAVVSQPPQLVVNIIANALMLCPESNDGTLIASVSGGSPNYSFQWSTGATTQVISNLPPGTYTVVVTDANGCIATASFTFDEFAEFDINFTTPEIVCGEANSGEVGVFITGTTGPYTYEWSTGDNSESVGGLGSGTYSVTVTDINGCTSSTETTLEVVTDFEIVVTPRDVICHGESTGSALAIVTGGTEPYSYTWSTGASTPEITNLPAGEYFLTVTDANDCILFTSVVINQPPPIVLTTFSTDVSCFGGNNGTARVQVQGGNQPYTFLWSNGSTNDQIVGLTAGSYTVTVQDISQCTAIATVEVDQPDQLVIIASTFNPSCASLTGSIAIATTGEVGNVRYLWNTGDTTANLIDVPPGLYSVTVTDDNNCQASSLVEITAPANLQLTFFVSNIICSSANEGSIIATVSGGTPPYTYNWSNGATTPAIFGLAPGSYTLTVRDAFNCIIVRTAVVTQSLQLQVVPTVNQISCFGFNNGSINLNVAGGLPPYFYNWSNGSQNASLSGLSPGLYSVTVTGSDGCSGSTAVTIFQPDLLNITTQATNLACNANNSGAVTTFTSGGIAPYTYLWSNGAQTPSIQNISAGTYNVTVTDANGCSAQGSAVVTQPGAIFLTTALLQTPCFGTNTGRVSASATNGSPPYQFTWSNGGIGQIQQNLFSGTYTVTVTDAQGCSSTASITVPAHPTPSCDITVLQYVVNGNDGALRATATGGTQPYAYQWSNSFTSPIITGLSAGTYALTVTDINGCSTTCTQQLQQPSQVGDFVWLDLNFNGLQDPGEPGIPGVTVILSGTAENQPYSDTTITNGNGIYGFIVPPGEYKLTFVLPSGSLLDPVTQNAGTNINTDSDINPMTLMTPFFTITAGQVNLTIDAGFAPPCINVTNPGSIGPDYQFLCGPGNIPATITSLTPPSGGTDAAPLEYIWMRSVSNTPFSSGFWELIPGTNAPDYNPGPLSRTTYFARCVRRSECGPFIESNVVVVEVGNISVAEIDGPEVACQFEPAVFTALGTAPNAIIQWNFGPGILPQTATGPVATVNFTSFGTFQVTLTVTQNGCTATATQPVTVTDNSIFCGDGLIIDADINTLRHVEVSWEVQASDPHMLFIVERSADGQNFEFLRQMISPNAIVNGMRKYQIIDQNPRFGLNYYQVRYESAMGARGTSNMEEIILQGDSRLVLLYPNPTINDVQIEFFETFAGDVSIELVSADGRQLQHTIVPQHTRRHRISLSAYPAGVYFVRLRYGDIELKRIKVLKQ